MPPDVRLTNIGLRMPDDFPRVAYETVLAVIAKRWSPVSEELLGAMNAIAYRFVAVGSYERELSVSLVQTSPEAEVRSEQERQLFGFFSSGFSVFESTFYALFFLGAYLAPQHFPVASERDRQRITPNATANALKAAFAGDQLNDVVASVTQDHSYLEWRDIRNILTHRATPGRTFFVSISGADDEKLADEWKLKGISLDEKMASGRRIQLAKHLAELMCATSNFLERH